MRLWPRPLTTTSPSNEFVGIDQTITYGTAGTAILSETAGIVDTGTTLLLIASSKSHCIGEGILDVECCG
jgi:hypothetical protein